MPSITELVCALGLAGNLVGRTGFCVHPKSALRGVPKIGGTKTADIEKIRELAPTHVIVNIDENTEATAIALANFVPHLIVTHPLSPLDNVALYRLLGGIFQREIQADELVASFTGVYERVLAAHRASARVQVLYLIWRQPWMTVSRDTYVSRTLALIGLETVPAVNTARYPEIELEAAARDAEVILLSTEPYSFREKHLAELRALPFLARVRVELIDGEMTSWYGPRAILGMDYLDALRRKLDTHIQ